MRRSFVRASDSLEQIGVTKMRLAVVWLKTQRLFHVRRGFIEFVLCRQHKSKVRMRLRVSRFETERTLILLFRLLPSAFFLQRDAIVKVLFRPGRHVRCKPCSALQFWYCDMRLPKPERTQRQDKYRHPF